MPPKFNHNIQLATLSDVKLFTFNCFEDSRGTLMPVEAENDIPIPLRRIFIVQPSRAGEERGAHAHYLCTQILCCLSGSCTVVVKDGVEEKEIALARPNQAVMIPPTLWGEEIYTSPNTILLVMCDRAYETKDYISEFNEYKLFRKKMLQGGRGEN